MNHQSFMSGNAWIAATAQLAATESDDFEKLIEANTLTILSASFTENTAADEMILWDTPANNFVEQLSHKLTKAMNDERDG